MRMRQWLPIAGWAAALLTQAGSAAPLPWLGTDGPVLVADTGRPVVLRGVNAGGWLVEEMWMMPLVTHPPKDSPFPEIRDHVTLWNTISRRLGPDETRRVRNGLRLAWLAEADFVRMRGAGMNCVRLPFLHDLEAEPDGLFVWLDAALAWAQRSGLYVLLDLHGAPGRQSKDHHTGEADRNLLFRDAANVERTAALWARVAARYRNRPEVAGYDLLNEPMGATNADQVYAVQDRIYRAIRAVDPRHLIFFEDGYKGIQHMPDPSVMHWTGVVASVHCYKFDAKSEADQLGHLKWLTSMIDREQARLRIPFHVGEFNLEPHGTPAALATYLGELERRRCSWSLWTYKTAKRRGSGDRSMWGWFRNPGPIDPIDPFRDSADEMVRKCEPLRTSRLVEYTAMTEAFRSAGRDQR